MEPGGKLSCLRCAVCVCTVDFGGGGVGIVTISSSIRLLIILPPTLARLLDPLVNFMS